FSDKYRSGLFNRELYKDYYKNELAAGRFSFGMEWLIRLFRFFRAFKIWTLTPRAKSILDIGSGRGFMLYYLKKIFGFKRVEGTQISPNAVLFSRNILGLTIHDQDLLDIEFKEPFEVITIWHVLEHVPDPIRYLERMYHLLTPKGKLVIEVPNFDSWTRPLTGKYWLGLDLDHHLSFFTPDSLTILLERNHFRVHRIHTFSLEYSTFLSAQSILSLLTKTDQFFFKWLQAPQWKGKALCHLSLFLILLPFCFLMNLLLYPTRKGEVLLMVAEK
ncbi:MAG: class I SAM-dependent methyltransferase, partial [Candidatus Aureabacteria bacterium]|nr:class I SAM-dependent methyltransferase [Candidatus Auribacterota bacterium]